MTSKSGLPEALKALGSPKETGILTTAKGDDPNRPKMCQAENCQGYRSHVVTLQNGKREGVYERSRAEIYIRDEKKNLIAAVCQKCHQKHLDERGLDQLSQVRTEGINAPQQDLPVTERAPPGLVDHLRQIEDQIAEQWSHLHDD